MVRPVVLGLLLACAASLCGSTEILESSSALIWAQTFEQVGDMPKQGEKVKPDPWLYLHRMSFYRLLIEATNPYMGSMGPSATDSPLWGLPLQLSWMLNSERLADPSGETTCGAKTGETICISAKSWWSCENYFASVIPFLSAIKQNIIGNDLEVEMKRPAGAEEYCTTYTECLTSHNDAMTKWDAFFQGLKASHGSTQPDIEKKDYLLGLFWEAQMASMNDSAACNSTKEFYSPEEMSFAKSWMNAAQYVSAARFHSNFKNAATFISPLPSRILNPGDVAPDIADLTAEENHTLNTFSWIEIFNRALGGRLVSMWNAAMCSVTTREKGRHLLEQLMLNPSFATGTLLYILTEMTTSC